MAQAAAPSTPMTSPNPASPSDPTGPGSVLPAAVEARLHSYTPNLDGRRLSERDWTSWAPVLRDRVRATGPNVNTAKARMSAATGLLAWALAQRLPLTENVEVLWRESTRERYLTQLAQAGTQPGSITTLRSHLRSLADATVPTPVAAVVACEAPAETGSGWALLDPRSSAGVEDLGLPPAGRYWALLSQVRALVVQAHPDALTAGSCTPGRSSAVPYGDVELARLLRATSSIRTPRTRASARALLALGAGAGLAGLEATRVRGTDVHHDPSTGQLTVTVAGRQVPVLDVWAPLLRQLASDAGAKPLLGGGNNSKAADRPHALATALASADKHAIRCDSTRLRTTWLITHLAAGTPLPTLLRQAGLVGTQSLEQHLPYTPDLATPTVSWIDGATGGAA